jgi:hypothetical protein
VILPGGKGPRVPLLGSRVMARKKMAGDARMGSDEEIILYKRLLSFSCFKGVGSIFVDVIYGVWGVLEVISSHVEASNFQKRTF